MVIRKTESPCKVLFLGGPRDGEYRNYEKDPVAVGCFTEADSKGMHGVYRTTEFSGGVVTMVWRELPVPDLKSSFALPDGY